jgi:hypothetical protein
MRATKIPGAAPSRRLWNTTLDAGDGSVMQIPNNLFFQKVLHRRHRRQEVSLASQLRARDRHPLGNAASAKD